MKKFIISLFTFGILFGSFFGTSYAISLELGSNAGGQNINASSPNSGMNRNNQALEELNAGNSNQNQFFDVGVKGEKGIQNLLVNIARDIKNVFFIIATIIMFILVFRLLFSDNSEEEAEKFKSGIIWTALGIVVMQIAFVFYKVMFDKRVNGGLADTLSSAILEPFTRVMMTAAAFLFIAVAIFAFYKLVTANGDDESISKGKMTIVYGILGFIVIKFANLLVESTYGKVKCTQDVISIDLQGACIERPEIEGVMGIITTLINWVNGFLGIIIVLLIIYAGFLIFTSKGDEEKTSKAKNILLYVFLGLLLLVVNYLILTFFILPENAIGN